MLESRAAGTWGPAATPSRCRDRVVWFTTKSSKFVFTGPPVPVTARMHTTPKYTITTYTYCTLFVHFYGSFCARNGKDAHDIPETHP
eukprot:1649029-Pyramimonas_sp.AAC.1